jgi:hypothetical protein
MELRLAYHDPGDRPQRIDTPDGSLFLDDVPLVTDADLHSVSVIDAEGNVMLSANCTPEADRRLREASSAHVGSPAAVFWNGELKALPIIRSPLGCAPLQIAWEAPAHEVRAVEEVVRQRWGESAQD